MSTRMDFSNYNEDRCSICGCTARAASWRGKKLILVCEDCAIKVLPVLIADATYAKSWRPRRSKAIWKRLPPSFGRPRRPMPIVLAFGKFRQASQITRSET